MAKKTLKAKDFNNLTEVYSTVEQNLLNNMYKTENLLTFALEDENYSAAKNLSAIHKEIMGNYNEAVRLRKINGVEEGRFIPIDVLETYQNDVFPSIGTAVENLRVDILNVIPENIRPVVEMAWRNAYPKFINAVEQAGDKLDDYVKEVQEQAMYEQKGNNNRTSNLDSNARPTQKRQRVNKNYDDSTEGKKDKARKAKLGK